MELIKEDYLKIKKAMIQGARCKKYRGGKTKIRSDH